MSHVRVKGKKSFFDDVLKELVDGGSVINGAYPVQYISIFVLHSLEASCGGSFFNVATLSSF